MTTTTSVTTSLETLTSSLLSLSPAHWVQTLFILTSCAVLAITVAPAAERKLLLNYGARRSHDVPTTNNEDKVAADKDEAEDSLVQAVRKLTSLGQVPHSWFFTYYVFYILCAEAWAAQYFMDGPYLLGWLASRQVETTPSTPTVNGSQIVMLWIMMFVQAARRLYECFVVMRPSKSTMWFVHWVLGLGYYFGVSVAIWIEGSGMLLGDGVLIGKHADALDSCHSAEGAAWSLDGRCTAQGGHRIAVIFERLGHATPMPQTSRGPQEIFAARLWHVSLPRLSPLHVRVLDLFLIGNPRGPAGTVVQQDTVVRADFRGCESRCDRLRHQELVYREVWAREGEDKVDHAPNCVLNRCLIDTLVLFSA